MFSINSRYSISNFTTQFPQCCFRHIKCRLVLVRFSIFLDQFDTLNTALVLILSLIYVFKTFYGGHLEWKHAVRCCTEVIIVGRYKYIDQQTLAEKIPAPRQEVTIIES